MEKRLFLVAVLCFGHRSASLADDPCSFLQSGETFPEAIPMPDLPVDTFKTVIRGVLNSNQTVTAYEYVSVRANVASMKMIQNGQTMTVIMNYSTNESFTIAPNSADFNTAGPLCIAQNLVNDPNVKMFGGYSSASHPHLLSTSRALHVFRDGTEIYRGRTTVDGIPVNWWSRCMHWEGSLNASFTLHYYFTVPGWKTESGLDQVPLRAEVKGLVMKNGTPVNFSHVYDYVNFEPYVDDPENAFQTPPGVYCMGRKPTRSLPPIDRHLHFSTEISQPGNRNGGSPTVSSYEVWYDYSLLLIRTDTRTVPEGTSKNFRQNRGPFTTIHDFNEGIQYVIDQDTQECSTDPIPKFAKNYDAVHNSTRETLTMRSPLELFNLDSNKFVYVGQRKARGQLCQVFQTVLDSFPEQGLVTYEIYFLSNDVSTPERNDVPWRILFWKKGQLYLQYEYHGFDARSQHANVYDVTPCFPGHNSIDFIMTLNAKFRKTTSAPMTGEDLKHARNVHSVEECATLCDNSREFQCSQFNYCPTNNLCFLVNPTTESSGPKTWNMTCDYYQRVVETSAYTQPSIDTVWKSLKNRVENTDISVTLKLPDADGHVDVSVDTSTLDDSQPFGPCKSAHVRLHNGVTSQDDQWCNATHAVVKENNLDSRSDYKDLTDANRDTTGADHHYPTPA